jgi:hypothetical protein
MATFVFCGLDYQAAVTAYLRVTEKPVPASAQRDDR